MAKWINIGTITEVLFLLVTAALFFLPQYLITITPSLYGESLLTIGYMIVYATLILLLFLYNRTVTDIQKGIKVTLVRALINVILPIPLIFPLATWMGLVWILAIIFFILSFIRFLLLLLVVRTLLALQKKYST